MKIYGDKVSGNCYKVQLLCALLDLEYQWIDVDILKQETRSSGFLGKNPAGQIPLLELDDGRLLAESNAILNYLGEGSIYIPSDRFARARMLEWQFFEQYSHEPYIAVARFINRYLGLPEERRAEFESRQPGGHRALGVLQRQLESSPWLVGEAASLADLSLFAYTHVADEGGFDLGRYPAVLAWIEQIKALPGFQPMSSGS